MHQSLVTDRAMDFMAYAAGEQCSTTDGHQGSYLSEVLGPRCQNTLRDTGTERNVLAILLEMEF